MPYSYAIYTGNGSQTQYAVSFPYIRKEHIVAYVNYSLTTAFTWVNDSTIQFATAPGNGQRVEIRRYSPTNARLVDYTDGSTLVAADLDTDSTQHLYKEQELDDDIKQSVYVDPTTGLPTASNQRITNVADPIAAQDVATKNYVDTTTVASAGDTMTGPLAMGTNKITGLGEPTNPQDAATKNYVDNTFVDNTTDLIDSTETWVSNDTKIATTAAADARHTMVVNPTTPTVPAGGWQVGKTWLQNDVNKTLSYWTGSNWSGIASGGTFTLQPTVIYVDSVNGDDTNDGHRIINPKKTIKNAVQSAAAGDIIKVAPGVYQEVLPIDITVDNLSIVGDSQRSCFVHPTVATQEQIMFRCNSGTYIDGFTFAGLKASGARGGNAIDSNATYGLPASQGWVAGFYPGCVVKKSPYINNCSNFADASIDNSNFNPNNYTGTGGDLTSAPTGGGIIVDGSLPAVNSPLRSFVVNEFTQVCLDGPGLLVCNNGYAQAVSFFGLFCHYHAKALSGGQINMEVGTTDFGRYGLIADGKSSSAIFTATANGNASAGATTFAINAPTAAGTWFGDATRPATNMLVQIGADIYPILSSTANGAGWNVVISRPDPANRAVNLGLINGHSSGATVSFFLRSMISTASHTMEYAGSGTNYNALPENGGVPVEANEVVNLNNGKVWLTSTDQSGKFKVGDTFQVDQQTGFVTIDPNSYSPNIVQDLSPELGGNLDVLTRNIYSSTGNVYINDTLEVNSGTAAAPAITFNGDTNTGIYRPGADQVAISTGGSGRLFVDSSGRVGVGTASPTQDFEIARGVGTSAYISLRGNNESAATGFFIGQDSSGLARLFQDGNKAITFWTGGAASERVRIDSSGRVGIGTTSPGELLHVYNSAATSRLIVGPSGTGAATPNALALEQENTGYTVAHVRNIYNNSGLAELRLGGYGFTTFTSGSSQTERARIDSSGRLLVGTSTAQSGTRSQYSKFTVQGNNQSTSDGAQVNLANNTNAPSLNTGDTLGQVIFTDNGPGEYGKIACQMDGAGAGTNDYPGRLVFSTTADGASSPTERMRITNQGYLYSGVTSAEGINSAQAVTGERIVNINSDTLSDQAASHMARQGNTANDGTAQSCYLAYYRDAVATGPGAFFKGYRGSGGTNGTIRIKINSDGNITNSNNSYGSLSDAKLKENIVDASSQWDDIKNLRVRNYNFKEETGQQTHRQIGLIAQEAEQISPGLVIDFPDANNEITKSINYSVLYMKAVKALQEAMDRIEQLEAEMAEVKARLS